MIKTLVVGPLGVNCHIVFCDRTKEGAVVDPGGDVKDIIALVREHGVTVKYILNTHGHFDHVGGNDAVRQATGAPVLIHPLDAPLLPKAAEHSAAFGVPATAQSEADGFLEDKMTLQIGELALTVLYTPGHTKGGVCFLGNGFVITGDTLFAGSIGRTDLPGGHYGRLIESIREKLLGLDDETTVLPGHGPESDIGQERRSNPFLAA